MNKGLFKRRRIIKEQGVVVEQEFRETTEGKRLGYSLEEMKPLFMIIKDPSMRIELMNKAHDKKIPLSELVKRIRDSLVR